MRDNPDSFYNEVLSSDILHDLKKVNGKATDKDVRNFTSNIKKTIPYPQTFEVFLAPHPVVEVTS